MHILGNIVNMVTKMSNYYINKCHREYGENILDKSENITVFLFLLINVFYLWILRYFNTM